MTPVDLARLRAEVAELREWKLHAETHMEREEKLADREKEKLLEARHAADSAAFTERAAIVVMLRVASEACRADCDYDGQDALEAVRSKIKDGRHHRETL